MDDLNAVVPWKRCITLKETPDRTNAAKEEFDRLGWTVPFFITAKDVENPGRGCYASHYAVMAQALRDGAEHALVFEDDAILAPEDDSARIAKDVASFLRHTKDKTWDMLLLGHCGSTYNTACTKFEKKAPHIFQSDCLCTHAVVYNRPFMQRFVTYHEEYPGYEIDDYFRDIDAVIYVVKPGIFVQRDDVDSVIDAGGSRSFARPPSTYREGSMQMWVITACAMLAALGTWLLRKSST